MRATPLLASLILGLVAVAHLLRLVFRVEIVAGGVIVPLWVGLFGMVVPGVLAAALWNDARRNGRPHSGS